MMITLQYCRFLIPIISKIREQFVLINNKHRYFYNEYQIKVNETNYLHIHGPSGIILECLLKRYILFNYSPGCIKLLFG